MKYNKVAKEMAEDKSLKTKRELNFVNLYGSGVVSGKAFFEFKGKIQD